MKNDIPAETNSVNNFGHIVGFTLIIHQGLKCTAVKALNPKVYTKNCIQILDEQDKKIDK